MYLEEIMFIIGFGIAIVGGAAAQLWLLFWLARKSKERRARQDEYLIAHIHPDGQVEVSPFSADLVKKRLADEDELDQAVRIANGGIR